MNEVVDVKNFIRSTRDSGYRNLSLALAELIDNSVQAGASMVEVTLPSDSQPQHDRFIAVLDDGCGMNRTTLHRSLAFGGSSRFDSRTGLGRFGMGLPNSSLSQARRLEVYSWKGDECHAASLDLDRLLAMKCPSLEAIRDLAPAASIAGRASTGTLVRWLRLDRPAPRSWAKESERLRSAIGRVFRHLLRTGLSIRIDGIDVPPHDPLMLETPVDRPFGRAYGETLVVEVGHLLGLPAQASVRIRFSEIDVLRLSHLAAGDKRALGIVGGAGVSVVRADREIDYRWAFIAKRKENYDEWWRCEVSFDPVLDEAFGVTNTKQGIRPSERLRSILTPLITGVARTLNARARAAHAEAAALRRSPAEAASRHAARVLEACSATERPSRWVLPSSLRVGTRRLSSPCLMRMETDGGGTTAVLNENHPFHQVFYGPLTDGALSAAEIQQGVDLLLLAIARCRSDEGSDLDTLLRLFFRNLG